MITLFSKQTAPLPDYERDTLLPIMVRCLERHVGRDAAITNSQMCEKMCAYGYQLNEVRTRKIINHIRINALVPHLIATGKGYYVSGDEAEIRRYIESLKDREAAIAAVRMAIEGQLGEFANKSSSQPIRIL